MQIKVKTNSIEPLVEAVLNDFFTPAAAPHVKNEYELTVVMDKTIRYITAIADSFSDAEPINCFKVTFEIKIPRLGFYRKYSFDFAANITLSEVLGGFSLRFAAKIYLDLHNDQSIRFSDLTTARATEILQPIFDKCCRICGGRLELSQAFKPAGFIPMIEQNGDISTDLTYHSDSVGLVKCKKCKSCGKSFIPPKPAPAGVITIK